MLTKRICLFSLCGLLIITLITPTLADGGWTAEYFANRDLSGGPTLTRNEGALHFEWGTGSPDVSIPADDFSARFSRDEWLAGGTYRFSYRADDGLRLWVDDGLVIDAWNDQEAVWHFRDYAISQGTHHIRVEYYEHGGGAALQVAWEPVSSEGTWRADYFPNQNLQAPAALVRQDPAIDFDWGSGSPDTAVPADNFSVRWARTIGFEAGTYRFYASCDDGVRITVDQRSVVDEWYTQQLPNTRSGDITLGAGQHTVIVEYFEQGGDAHAHVWWNRLDTLSGWEGRYYDNRELVGGPALIRDDAEINFDWGEGAPISWMPSDDFSVKWTRQIDFEPGLYRFNVRADDGFRLWLDEVDLRMNFWEPQDFDWHYQDWHYLEGNHTVTLEYFEAAGGARVQLWWDYATTVDAAQAMAPSPEYGFPTAANPPASATPAASTPVPATTPVPAAPTDTPISTPSPTTALPGPWRAEYFNGRDLSTDPVLVRDDVAIDFDWGWNAPTDEITANHFAVRWTGAFDFEDGRYRFTTTTDDGVRLYVDDELLLDSWQLMRGTRYVTRKISQGKHTVRIEYFESTQAAKATVDWEPVRVPSTTPTPTPTPATVSGLTANWTIRYYDNRTLSGDSIVETQHKEPLDFDWGLQSPADAVPADYFSASFEASVDFEDGRYRFTTTSDDGVRLYVDDDLVIDSWYAMRGSRYVTLDLTEGEHTVRLEYFERGGAAKVMLKVENQ